MSAVLTIPNQTMLLAAICICGMGVFGLVYDGSLAVLRGESYAKALTATVMQWRRSWHTSCCSAAGCCCTEAGKSASTW